MLGTFSNSYSKLYLIFAFYIAFIKSIYCVYYDKPNKVVNIVNVENNLCLSYKKNDYIARLIECNSKNERQQWIIPTKTGYYVNKYIKNSFRIRVHMNDCDKLSEDQKWEYKIISKKYESKEKKYLLG